MSLFVSLFVFVSVSVSNLILHLVAVERRVFFFCFSSGLFSSVISPSLSLFSLSHPVDSSFHGMRDLQWLMCWTCTSLRPDMSSDTNCDITTHLFIIKALCMGACCKEHISSQNRKLKKKLNPSAVINIAMYVGILSVFHCSLFCSFWFSLFLLIVYDAFIKMIEIIIVIHQTYIELFGTLRDI